MKTRSVLVYLPGYLSDLQALTPQRHLAQAAGALLDSGHETWIMDLGTTDSLDRVVSEKLAAYARRVAQGLFDHASPSTLETLHLLWQVRLADNEYRKRLQALALDTAKHVASFRGLHFIAFFIKSPEDVRPCAIMSGMLRQLRPKLRIAAFGPFADRHGSSLLPLIPDVDCICRGDLEVALPEWAERIDPEEQWSLADNLLSRHDVPAYRKVPAHMGSFASGSAPVYDCSVYPALTAPGQKLKLFELEDARSGPSMGFACEDSAAPLRIKPATVVCTEIWRLGALYGAGAFHFSSPQTPSFHVNGLAYEFLRRNLSIAYSRRLCVSNGAATAFPVLRASGCDSVAFDVATGSQRLLDRHYGTRATVTGIEHTLRSAKEADLLSIARFIYPCPEDDYHTSAETIRLIERTKPDLVTLAYPILAPDCEWFRRPASFGYHVDKLGFTKAIVSYRKQFPLPDMRWRNLPYRIGDMSTAEVISVQETLGVELASRGHRVCGSDFLLRAVRLAGYTDRDTELVPRTQRALVEGDVSMIGGFMDQFNEAVCASAKRIALQPQDGLRPAVGN
ncbi:MAG: hypothetical protein WC655_12905 [Candidatus Hydrogenedentales bacterium]|jgi:hypothetical protein